MLELWKEHYQQINSGLCDSKRKYDRSICYSVILVLTTLQIRWAQLLTKILRKFRKKLSLTVEWRPLFKIVTEVHFKR